MFKELFTINYNGKEFLILVDKNHRKTFLEVVGVNKYMHPTYEDYKELNEIYNNYDYSVKAAPRLMTYEERIRYKASTLLVNAALIAGYGLLGKLILDIPSSEYKNISLAFEELYKGSITDRSALDAYYGSDVITRDDVVRAINENDNLNDYYKEIAIKVLDTNLELDPDINLRIYYENIKKMHLFVDTNDRITVYGFSRRASYFSIPSGNIHMRNDIANDDASVFHEFEHATHNIMDNSGDKVLDIHDQRGFSLEEAMTECKVAYAYDKGTCYYYQRKMLSFLIDNVDDFNYHIYNKEGIAALISELKTKYPQVDIDYLIDYIDNYTITSGNAIVQNVIDIPYKSENFVDELFNITLNNIAKDDPYLAFETFMKQFAPNVDMSVYNKYQKLYLDKLLELGYITEKQAMQITNMQDVICLDDNIYFANNMAHKYFLSMDELGTYNPDDSMLISNLSYDSRNNIANDIILNDGTFNDINVYLKSFVLKIKSINRLDRETKENLLDAIYRLNLNGIKKDNLYEGIDNVLGLLLHPWEVNYYGDKYIHEYDQMLINNGYVSADIVNIVRNMEGYIVKDEKIIPVWKNNNSELLLGFVHRRTSRNGSAYAYSDVRFGRPFNFQTIAADGTITDMQIGDEVVEVLDLTLTGQNSLIQYMTLIQKDNNVLDEQYLYDAFCVLGIVDDNRGKLLENGGVIFNEITDAAYVEIGFDKDNNVGLMLYDGDKLICRTVSEFATETFKIPYKTYLIIGNNKPSDIEHYVSLSYLNSIPDEVLKYFVPNVMIEENYSETTGIYSRKYIHSAAIMLDTGSKKDYLRKVLIYSDHDKLYVRVFENEYLLVDNLLASPYDFFEGKDIYFRFFQDCLDEYGVLIGDDNAYHVSEEDVVYLANKYIEEEFGVVKTRHR